MLDLLFLSHFSNTVTLWLHWMHDSLTFDWCFAVSMCNSIRHWWAEAVGSTFAHKDWNRNIWWMFGKGRCLARAVFFKKCFCFLINVTSTFITVLPQALIYWMFYSESTWKHQLLKEKFVFCTLSLIIRIFTIIYDVIQYYYDNHGSPESWSSLLTSSLAENNRGACALRQSIKKYNQHLFFYKTWNSPDV